MTCINTVIGDFICEMICSETFGMVLVYRTRLDRPCYSLRLCIVKNIQALCHLRSVCNVCLPSLQFSAPYGFSFQTKFHITVSFLHKEIVLLTSLFFLHFKAPC